MTVLDFWRDTPTSNGGTLMLTTSSRDRIKGSFTLNHTNGDETCTFNLRRAYELDSDD